MRRLGRKSKLLSHPNPSQISQQRRVPALSSSWILRLSARTDLAMGAAGFGFACPARSSQTSLQATNARVSLCFRCASHSGGGGLSKINDAGIGTPGNLGTMLLKALSPRTQRGNTARSSLGFQLLLQRVPKLYLDPKNRAGWC